MQDGIERVVVYISDQNKNVKVDTSQVELPLPRFKCKNETQELIEKLAIPFSVLNCSNNYIYTPTDK
jgi:hypothetical protein